MRSPLTACVALLVTLAACTSAEPEAPEASPTGEPQVPAATLRAENLELLPGPEHAVRIMLGTTDDTVRVIVRSRPDTARVSLCALTAPDDALDRCRSVASGVREPIGTRELAGVAILLDDEGPARSDVVIEFSEATRALSITIPRMRAPATAACDDNACNPFFELDPPIGGSFDAEATWSGPQAELVLLQGSVRGRAATATGVPYIEAVRAEGPSPLSIGTRLQAPGEYALVFRHLDLRPGAPAMQDVTIRAAWPERAG